MRAWILPVLAALLAAAAGPVMAADPVWQPLDHLSDGDRSLAVAALADDFGDDPALWPDWLQPSAVRLPLVFSNGSLLVVREPLRRPCGEYAFTIYGPLRSDGLRNRWGEPVCAGSLTVVPAPFQRVPDLKFEAGYEKDGDGAWLRHDRILHWTGSFWSEAP